MPILKKISYKDTKSFIKKNDGMGMIEAAITLPLFLTFLFGVIEFGYMMLQKNGITNVAQNVATAIQEKPNISGEDLYAYVKTLGGGVVPFNETPEKTIERFGLGIKSSKQPLTIDDLRGLSSWNYANPWLSDSDPSNDSNIYYVGVYTNWQYRDLTGLLQKITGSSTKHFENTAVVAIGNRMPVCPTDQVLISQGNGTYRCSITTEIPVTIKYGTVVRGEEKNNTSYRDKCKVILMDTWPNTNIIGTGPIDGCPENMVLTEAWPVEKGNCGTSNAPTITPTSDNVTWNDQSWWYGDSRRSISSGMGCGSYNDDASCPDGYYVSGMDRCYVGSEERFAVQCKPLQLPKCTFDLYGMCCPAFVTVPK